MEWSKNYHLRALRHIRPSVDQDTANTIACSLVRTRLDYYNAILYGVTKQNIGCLQRVQNSHVRVVCLAPHWSFASRFRRRLHWLPVQERLTFKIAMLTHKVLTHHQPGYLSELIVENLYNLRSVDNNLLIKTRTKTKFVWRAFRVSATTIWNSHSLSLGWTITISRCRSQLKTHVIGSLYCWSLTFKKGTAALTHTTEVYSILRKTELRRHAM